MILKYNIYFVFNYYLFFKLQNLIYFKYKNLLSIKTFGIYLNIWNRNKKFIDLFNLIKFSEIKLL
jgi:hypothetical protein